MALSRKDKKRLEKEKETKKTVEAHELISTADVENIRKALIETNADLVVQGMLDKDVRAQLEKIVRREYGHTVKRNQDVIDYIVSETIGTGVIEEILQDESITDVGYNGNELIIESNDNKQVFDTSFEITEEYIQRLVGKFANANDRDFTGKNPVFDGRFENVRINAVHAQNTAPESGTTMSLRVVRPKLALTEKNFQGFAPMFMLDFFEAAAKARANMVISGTTGTGKTELHKLISSYIPFDDRILLIEDTPETFMKEMFPEKDIYSWVTGQGVGVTELIKAGLRNNPAWIMVTETRGDEAYEMIQAVLSGHSIITSLHATSAEAIPTRFVNMAKMGYELSEEALTEDIKRYFHFGIHIKKVKYNGMVIRYLSEVVEFDIDGSRSIFKQRFVDGVFRFETFELSEEFELMMEEASVSLDFPDNFKSERPLDPNDVTFESTIPLDVNGRPDFAKMAEDGTNIDVLMDRETAQVLPEVETGPVNYVLNTDGFIEPELDDDPEEEEEDIEAVAPPEPVGPDAKIKEIKARVDTEAEKPKPRPSRPKRDADDMASIEDELSKILDNIDDGDDKPKIPLPKGRNRNADASPIDKTAIDKARAKVETVTTPKSASEILAEKRREMHARNV